MDRSWPQAQAYPVSAENGTPNLDKLRRQQAELGSHGNSDEEAHEHLRQQCPWYQAVSDGAAGDPEHYCKPASGSGQPSRLVVKLTPRTAEASTVPEPTVPPGGPGLFHVKGMQLPPYIQHLWHHLVARYGKHDAYRVAVGVVKKWAQGVNPGGWETRSGKGKKTHPDVQAAAQRNVAQWEADKARAHAQSREHESGHVRATVALTATMSKAEANYRGGGTPGHRCGDCSMFRDSTCSLVTGVISPGDVCDHFEARTGKVALNGDSVTGTRPYPGQRTLPLPPVPGPAKAVFTAHRVDDITSSLAHAEERMILARQSKAQRVYHMLHVNNHLSKSLDDAHALSDSVHKNYPAESRELGALNQTVGLAVAVSPEAKVATFAHLLETLCYHLGHAKRHAACMLEPDPAAVWKFNDDHASVHLKGAQEHAVKLGQHLMDNYPDEAEALRGLNSGKPPLYGSGKKKVALAGLEVRLADGGGTGGLGGGAVVTAPGAMYDVLPPGAGGKYSQYGLHQKPSQTVSPSPPLPPKVKIPTPAEVLALVSQVPECADLSLSTSVRKFLEQAAGKLQKNDELEALHMLRSAGTAVLSAHKADLGQVMPAFYTAGVFSRIPPAEQSSAGQAVLEGVERHKQWRELEQAVQGLADRIRKRFFHGQYNGPSLMNRLTEDSVSSALDKVLALAGQEAPAAQDVSFPTESDLSKQATLMQPPDVLVINDEASKELAALPALQRVQVTTFIAKAREAQGQVDLYASRQWLARAFYAVVNVRHAHELAAQLRHHLDTLAMQSSTTWADGSEHVQPRPASGGWASKNDAFDNRTAKLTATLRH